MFRYPDRPDSTDFDADATINAARDEVRRLFLESIPTFQQDGDRISFPGSVLGSKSDHWRSYKAPFAKIQHGRCGYCEAMAIGTQNGDVEHYRPKGRLRMLDPDNQGQEKAHLANIEGRKFLREIGTGYWWDAYNWDNYLLACKICNQRWKADYFPVVGDPMTRPRPSEDNNEQALLLHPFGADEPADHLAYDLDGLIHGKTPKGVATIETAGLWRASLVSKRRPLLLQLFRLINEMLNPNASDDLVRSNARTIHEKGSLDWPQFPGMVRIFFTQTTKMDWAELTQMLEP